MRWSARYRRVAEFAWSLVEQIGLHYLVAACVYVPEFPTTDRGELD